MIVREKRRESYSVISNQPIKDSTLSWEARGLLCYLLSQPDDWRTSIELLERDGPARRDKLARMLKELEQHGYLERQCLRRPDGSFYWKQIVHELPIAPSTGNPTTAKPPTVKADISISTDLQSPDLQIKEEDKRSAEPEFGGSRSEPSQPTPFALAGNVSSGKLEPGPEWKEDMWLWRFLTEEQRTWEGERLKPLLNCSFWDDVSEVINGIDLSTCQREFVKMKLWLRDNCSRMPTPRGVRRFVSTWFERAYERERRNGYQAQGRQQGR